MITHNLGYPRIGNERELKKACELYWAAKSTFTELIQAASRIKKQHWKLQKEAGVDLIPSNDFSFYDHVLDMSLMVGAIPERYHQIILDKGNTELDLYFAMARGYQQKGCDVIAMEMTKWFDTNYHYIVPEFKKSQTFHLFSNKAVTDFVEAKQQGLLTKPVLLGPITYLLLGKEKENGFHRIELLDRLLPVYYELLEKLQDHGAEWIQFDEPYLSMDLTEQEKIAYRSTYQLLRQRFPHLKFIVATYFDCTGDNIITAIDLPVDVLHVDLVRCPSQLDDLLSLPSFIDSPMTLSLGLIDGRNIWKNDYLKSKALIDKAIAVIGISRVWIAPSCSLLHTPCDLDEEQDEKTLTPEIKNWMAFAKQKLYELIELKNLVTKTNDVLSITAFERNQKAIHERKKSSLIHKYEVKERVRNLTESDSKRKNIFSIRQKKQQQVLKLPLFPTTTIGSFPQTDEVRGLRSKLKRGLLTWDQYETEIQHEINRSITWQEQLGLDVLVHGEFERNDMVEYFGEQLEGYVFSQNGWVQSYGSRCVKPPIIYGDIQRPIPMTVKWSTYAQSKTKKWMKGMLTGPVTILQWSFVRDDQSREATAMQIALAIRDEVNDLERAGIKIIQVDEPAIREGLPIRKSDWKHYLTWAVKAFRISTSGVNDETQIHTHMCYSEFNDIIESIAALDADVITIETSRSQMELLDVFAAFNYPNEIGPGVYDIHSPRIPSSEEMILLLNKALDVIPKKNLWVNPDCGLKTRKWPETEEALKNMVMAVRQLRKIEVEAE